jgi:hypothetical protein
LGAFARIAVMVMYWPAWLQTLDSPRFARIDPQAIFSDYWMPAGYPLFVRTLRHIVPLISFTILIQHLIGLAVGLILFLAARRAGARRWVACIPAGVAFLAGDQIWLEHQIMADSQMTALAAAGLACGVRGLVPRVSRGWLAAAGVLLAGAYLTRTIAIALVPLLVIVAATAGGPGLRRRVAAAGAVLLPALLVLGLYVAAFEINGGQYLGLADMAGWDLYARVAPFANCNAFTPPAGTAQLCERTPQSQRPGTLAYIWLPNSFARERVPLGPQTSGKMERFALAVIEHQPGAYLTTVATDMLRYIDPSIGLQRAGSGQTSQLLSFGLVDPGTLQLIQHAMALRYDDTSEHVFGRQILATYQNLFRVGGGVLAALMLLTLAGLVVTRGPTRIGVALFGLGGLSLYVIPVATLTYDFRYGIPGQTFIVVSGTLVAADLLGRRLRIVRTDRAG